MNEGKEIAAAPAERHRIEVEYRRRELEVEADLYAPWQPDHQLMLAGRRRAAAGLLRKAGVFPKRGRPVLEVGCGYLGWLCDLVGWGVRETDLHAIELDPLRASRAREGLPLADIQVGDASNLPWPNDMFQLVVASTVFTSILNHDVRRGIAAEMTRVLAPRGAVLWYDFAYNNPGNAHVRRVGRRELKQLFPNLRSELKSVTLAPPLARLIAPVSWVCATALEAVPLLRTHLLAVLVKPAGRTHNVTDWVAG